MWCLPERMSRRIPGAQAQNRRPGRPRGQRLDWAPVRSLPAVVTLVAAAILQAMGMYQYTGDTIALSGQVFFPLLFGLMAVYLAWRTKDAPRFGVVHAVLMLLGFAALVLTAVGNIMRVYSLYPSPYLYYAAFAVLVVELFFRILGMPKKVRDPQAAPRRTSRRRRPAGQGPTNLVARPKDQPREDAEADVADAASARGAGSSDAAR